MSATANGTINGRTAVITGAGSGIGQAVARRLAAHGCPVALIVANARYRGEHADVESAAAAFADIARTTPEKAAKIIHKGIEDGRPRIRVGPDAVMFDLLARLTPNRYYDVIERLETLLRRAS
jgi:NAD(P)-dependent dehydrogenase (short-subunit alcohol dehydrogenase family)